MWGWAGSLDPAVKHVLSCFPWCLVPWLLFHLALNLWGFTVQLRSYHSFLSGIFITCSRLTSVPPSSKIHTYSGLQTVTLFGNRVFENVIKLIWKHTRLKWVLNPGAGILIRHNWTQRRVPCADGDRDWRDAVTSQRSPRMSRNQKKLEEAKGILP